MAQLRIQAIPLESLDASTLSSSYQAINPAGLPQACFLIEITNGSSTQPVTISLDGVNDHLVIFASGMRDYQGPINTQPNSRGALWPLGQIFYAKGTASTGSIGLSGLYQGQP